MLFDKRCNLDAAIENKVERRRVKRRRTPPISQRTSMEGHEVRKAYLHLVHGEADDSESGAMVEQPKCGFLPDPGPGTLKDNPLVRSQSSLLGKRLYGILDIALLHPARVERERGVAAKRV